MKKHESIKDLTSEQLHHAQSYLNFCGDRADVETELEEWEIRKQFTDEQVDQITELVQRRADTNMDFNTTLACAINEYIADLKLTKAA